WSQHRHANYYLAAVSFSEACVFPIPPDVMLISMTLAKPARVWRYAAITVISSVCGGVLGYFLGYFALELIYPIIEYFNYTDGYMQVQAWFQRWGFWALLIAGFTPIPYKLFTIAAGATQMSLLPFIVAVIIARTLRFYLVAFLLYISGDSLKNFLHKYIDAIGWIVVAGAIIAYIVYRIIK
ncbi:MAG: YqaA family protein, partial [Gammaproteobacteria bacterium]